MRRGAAQGGPPRGLLGMARGGGIANSNQARNRRPRYRRLYSRTGRPRGVAQPNRFGAFLKKPAPSARNAALLTGNSQRSLAAIRRRHGRRQSL